MEKLLDFRTVSFDTNGGTSVPEQRLLRGEPLIKPGDPTKENYVFIGWADINDVEWDFNAPPGGNMTLYAKWIGFGFSLSVYNHEFDAVAEGYTSVNALTVTISNNSDTSPVSDLTLTLGGDNAYAFNLSTPIISSILPGETATFTVAPELGQLEGTYTAVVTVSNAIMSVNLYISFSVILNTVFVISNDGTTGYSNLILALNAVNSGAAGDYEVQIETSQWLTPYPFTSVSGKTITLRRGSSNRVEIRLSQNGNLFTINSGITLRLSDGITLAGLNSNNASLVRINNSGRLIMESDAEIRSNNSGTSNGGGVDVSVGGFFEMFGGSINGNSTTNGGGGGVYISYNGNFTMNGGSINNNTTSGGGGGGGVFLSGSGIFNMNGGSINNNTAGGGGGGVFVESGGTFDISTSGGLIYNNYSSNDGGGVFVGGFFGMKGGEIRGNFGRIGGGVYITNTGFFEKQGGIIYGADNSSLFNNSQFPELGHAAHHASDPPKIKTDTSGQVDGMSSGTHGAPGGWDPLPLTGTVTINGVPNVNQTLTANTSGTNIQSGTNTFQWMRGTVNVGTNSNTYTLAEADEGQNITVTVTNNYYSGTITSNPVLILAAYGTMNNPFLVNNEDDLRAVGRGDTQGYTGWTPAAHYKLEANITLTPPGVNNWTPIPTFSGSFNGNGHTITGLTIVETTTENDWGLFRSVSGNIRNLGLVNLTINVPNANNVGGIAGMLTGNGSIENSYVIGIITGNRDVGGITGRLNSITNTVQNCYAVVTVSGDTQNAALGGVGGIVGDSSSGIVRNNVALNLSITNRQNTVPIGRIFGLFTQGSGTRSNNHAWNDMQINSTQYTQTTGLNAKDGQNVTAAQVSTTAFWEITVGWDTDIWTFTANNLPSLKNSPAPVWPAHL